MPCLFLSDVAPSCKKAKYLLLVLCTFVYVSALTTGDDWNVVDPDPVFNMLNNAKRNQKEGILRPLEWDVIHVISSELTILRTCFQNH